MCRHDELIRRQIILSIQLVEYVIIANNRSGRQAVPDSVLRIHVNLLRGVAQLLTV